MRCKGHTFASKALSAPMHKIANCRGNEPRTRSIKPVQNPNLLYTLQHTQEGAATPVTNGERITSMVLLMLAGTFFYRAWGMGSALPGDTCRWVFAGCGGHAPHICVLFTRLSMVVTTTACFNAYQPRPHCRNLHLRARPEPPGGGVSLVGSGPLLSATASGLEQYLALVLLLACLTRVVLAR